MPIEIKPKRDVFAVLLDGLTQDVENLVAAQKRDGAIHDERKNILRAEAIILRLIDLLGQVQMPENVRDETKVVFRALALRDGLPVDIGIRLMTAIETVGTPSLPATQS